MKEELFGALEVFEGKVLIIMEVVIFALFHVPKGPLAFPTAFLLLRFRFALTFHKIGCTSAEQKQILRLFFCSAFGLHYLCTALYIIRCIY